MLVWLLCVIVGLHVYGCIRPSILPTYLTVTTLYSPEKLMEKVNYCTCSKWRRRRSTLAAPHSLPQRDSCICCQPRMLCSMTSHSTPQRWPTWHEKNSAPWNTTSQRLESVVTPITVQTDAKSLQPLSLLQGRESSSADWWENQNIFLKLTTHRT